MGLWVAYARIGAHLLCPASIFMYVVIWSFYTIYQHRCGYSTIETTNCTEFFFSDPNALKGLLVIRNFTDREIQCHNVA